MNLLSILIALACERLVSLRPELREPRALVGYVRGALRGVARRDPPAIATVILAASLPGLVVAAVSGVLGAVGPDSPRSARRCSCRPTTACSACCSGS